ncbi:TrmH family RNA methyltransferase [Silvibacterium acidisoli]|uniref:TrmH family RNA methyltransferase n=1 Tax=Acidobacteriaceae bacterium ZG23-2 TaxID=2883246 RepID=UPI00406C11DC
MKELRAAFALSSRSETGLVAIEGEKLIGEALSSGLALGAVFVRSGSEAQLDRLPIPGDVEILELPPDVFTSAVNTESPQGIAALVRPPAFTLDDILEQKQTPLIFVAAGLQDPGNLGTLIRSAEAFGATGAILLPGTVSPWNQKALRASAGSVFRLPVVSAKEDMAFAAVRKANIALLAAVVEDARPLSAVDLAAPAAIVLGNEGNGIPQRVLEHATHRIIIPCPGPVESLNAAIAGSVILYEASRQRAAQNPR